MPRFPRLPYKLPHTWWLTQQKCFLSPSEVWKPEVKGSSGLHLRWGSEGESVPCLFQLLVTPDSLDLWLHHSNLGFRLHKAFCSLLVSSSPLIRALVIGFRARPCNPRWSLLKTLTYICKAPREYVVEAGFHPRPLTESSHHGLQGL